MSGGHGRMVRRNAKDSVFVSFFRHEENVLELYRELHPEDLSSTVEDVRIRTAKRVIARGFTNDLGFSVGDKRICLVEAQSCHLRPMQLRALFYLAETYRAFMEERGMTLYDARGLPGWEVYVVNTSRGRGRLFSLQGISRDPMDEGGLEQVPVKEGGILWGYAEACRIIDTVISRKRDSEGKAAVATAFDECRARCGKIGEFIWSRRSEVMGVYEQMFDDEENMRMNCAAFEQKGFRRGEREGFKAGGEAIARRMLSKGMSPEEVSELTGIPSEEVLRLAEGRK
ncbi:MAG: hypothetical protein J5674_05915 [Candidatus Methanomethylophilaceae archaeon]|nr:hypothetical protein [Candidatus Methanomethylophilaceae archaeon]